MLSSVTWVMRVTCRLSFPDDGTKSTHKVKSTSRPNVRGRGRGREVIQSHSIFEQGPSVRTAAQSRRGGGM